MTTTKRVSSRIIELAKHGIELCNVSTTTRGKKGWAVLVGGQRDDVRAAGQNMTLEAALLLKADLERLAGGSAS